MNLLTDRRTVLLSAGGLTLGAFSCNFYSLWDQPPAR